MGLQCPSPKAELPAEQLLGMRLLLACLLGSSAVNNNMSTLTVCHWGSIGLDICTAAYGAQM